MEQNTDPRDKATNTLLLIFNKSAKHTQWGKDSLFSNSTGKIGYSYAK